MPFRCKCYKILVRWYSLTLKTVTKPDMIARDWKFVPECLCTDKMYLPSFSGVFLRKI